MVMPHNVPPDRFLVLSTPIYDALKATAQDVRGLMRFRFDEGLVERLDEPDALRRLDDLLHEQSAPVVRLIVDRLDAKLRSRLCELDPESRSRVHVHEYGKSPDRAVDSLSAPEGLITRAWFRAGTDHAPLPIEGDAAFCARYEHAFDKWLSDMVDQDLLDDVLDELEGEHVQVEPVAVDEPPPRSPRVATGLGVIHSTFTSRPEAVNSARFQLHARSVSSATRTTVLRSWPIVDGVPVPLVVDALEVEDYAELGRIHVVVSAQGPSPFWTPSRLLFLRPGGTAVVECTEWSFEQQGPGPGAEGVFVARAVLSDPGGDLRSDLLQAVDHVELQVDRWSATAVLTDARGLSMGDERLAAASSGPSAETLQWQLAADTLHLVVQAQLPSEPGQGDPVVVTVLATGTSASGAVTLLWLDADGQPVGIAPTTLTLVRQDDGVWRASAMLPDDDDLLVDRLRLSASIVPLRPGEQPPSR